MPVAPVRRAPSPRTIGRPYVGRVTKHPLEAPHMLKGFKEFVMRGNAVDLAVAVVIGAAFGQIVNAIVNNLINPLVAAVFGKPDISHVLTFKINGAIFSIGAILQAA